MSIKDNLYLDGMIEFYTHQQKDLLLNNCIIKDWKLMKVKIVQSSHIIKYKLKKLIKKQEKKL